MPLALAVMILLNGCALVRRSADHESAPTRDVARTQPGKEDEPTRVFDEETRNASLAKRFPGAKSIDLVRVLSWTEERSGACWTEATPPWEMKVDVRYTIRSAERATTLDELRRQGWLTLYRTPNGTGFERRAAFGAIDLDLATEYACRCASGASSTVEEKIPVRLRLRWQGKGKMPEVSAATEKDGQRRGLLVAYAPGNLLSYEFPVRAKYPAGHGGTCGGTLAVSLLSDPPMQ